VSKVTFVGASTTIYVSTGVTEIDAQIDLYSDWKEWIVATDNAKFTRAFLESVGGNNIATGLDVGDYYFFNNDVWKIKPYDGDHVLTVTENLYPVNTSATMFLPVSARTVTIQLERSSLTQIAQADASSITAAVWEYPVASAEALASSTIGYDMVHHLHDLHYEGVVWVDSVNGVSGTTHPLGTRHQPTDSIANALIIAAANGLSEIKVIEDVTVGASDDISGFTITGSHASKSEVTLTVGCTTALTQFQTCSLKGTANGSIIVRDGLVEDLLDFEGILHQCVINPGGIRLSNGSAKPSHILDCFSGVPGTSTPEIDFNNVNVALGIRNYNGGVKLVNKNGAASVSIDMNSGQIILDGTVTAGTIVCRGIGKLTDNSVGATVNDEMHDSKFARESWKFRGLDANDPWTQTATGGYTQSSTIVQGITGDPDTQITVTRE